MSINKAIISGNLTRDPEVRSTQSGMAVLSFSVAVNERVKNQSGEWEDRPNFIDCTMFGTRAEKVSQYISKGSKVAVEGKLRWSQWEAKDGGKRSKVEVVVDEIELMSGGQRPQQAPQPQMAPPMQQGYAPVMQPQYQQPVPQYAQPSVYDEEIPF